MNTITKEKKDIQQPKHAQYTWPRNIANVEHLPKIQGFDFGEPFDFDTLMKSYATTGFQASNLAQATEIVNAMRREKAAIFFGFTSNMISSGVRDIISYIAKHHHVHIMVTPAGGIEEDVIKCMKHFVLGTFEVSGEHLFDHGINRTGNIFVPNDRFTYFDKFMRIFLETLYEKYTTKGTTLNTAAFAKELGLALAHDPETKEHHQESYLFWAAKNNIPVVCPALMDGSLGDMIHFFRQRHPDFIVDCASDIDILIKTALNSEKTGALVLGAGMCKHYILNANIFREGLDYTVYINTAQEFDGSDSGARIEEAITWGKVKPRTPAVKVHADATLVFPLLVAMTFAQENNKEQI